MFNNLIVFFTSTIHHSSSAREQTHIHWPKKLKNFARLSNLPTMESFALHSLSTTASFSHNHPSRLPLLRCISSRSPPPTISLPSLPTIQSHSAQPLTFPLLKPIPRFSTIRITTAPRDTPPPPPSQSPFSQPQPNYSP